MRAALPILLFALVTSSGALAGPPTPPGQPVGAIPWSPPSLAEHPAAIPLSSLPASQRRAHQIAAAKYSSAFGPLANVLANTAYVVGYLRLQQARRAAGMNVLNGVK